MRQEAEKDIKERRSDVQRSEHRLQQKEEALTNNTYDQARVEIAYQFGKLLSYSDEAIKQYIQKLQKQLIIIMQ